MTLKEVLKIKPYFYKIFWPDGTRSRKSDPDFAEKYEKYADYEADYDTEADYDEKGCNWGLTWIDVWERKEK